MQRFETTAVFGVVAVSLLLALIVFSSGPRHVANKPQFPSIPVEGVIVNVVVSPDNDNVAFTHFKEVPVTDRFLLKHGLKTEIDTRLHVLNVRSGGVTDYASAQVSAGIRPLDWHPNGTAVIFSTSPIDRTGQRFEIRRLTLKGGRDVRIIDPPEKNYTQRQSRIKVSPDGRYVGWTRSSSNAEELVVQELETQQRRVIVRGIQSQWNWGRDGATLYFVRGRSLRRYSLRDQREIVLVPDTIELDGYIYYPMYSPKGERIGFVRNGSFHTCDPATKRVKRHFSYDFYYSDYGWNDSGVCYMDALGSERVKKGRLMVNRLDGRPSRQVAVGRFSFPRWVGTTHILVRRGGAELWLVDVMTGQKRKLYPLRN